jgi:hypothetical protein
MASPKSARAAPARAGSDPQVEKAGRPLNPQDSPRVSPAQDRPRNALAPGYIETSLVAAFETTFDDLVCVRSWGKPVRLGDRIVGHVCVSDRNWAAFDSQGDLISANHHAEHVAVRAVLAHAGRRR